MIDNTIYLCYGFSEFMHGGYFYKENVIDELKVIKEDTDIFAQRFKDVNLEWFEKNFELKELTR